MSWQIKLLGVLQIENEAGEISDVMKSSKGCALLAYLFVTNAAQPRELLADLLWDATSTAQSLQNLRALLTRLRKWLPELEVTRKQVRFPTETAVSTDYHSLMAGLDSDDAEQISAALALYRGDLLEGFYLEEAPRFNEWLLLTREKLRQRVIGAFRQLCDEYRAQNDWVKGVAIAQRWLALDELDEEALRHLLQLLAASGQINVALQQYSVSRQRLWQELGVEPMDETRQLIVQIETFKETHGGGVAWNTVVGLPTRPPASDELPEPDNLPSHAYVPYQRNRDFVGRRDTLLEIGQALLPEEGDAGQRAVAITGMGGLGKTQLAVEFCYRYGRFFPGGVFWLSFANGQNVAEEVMIIGGERGLGLYQDAERLTQADKVGRVLKAWQEPIPRLLIFDTCEDEALLTQWLPVTGGCRVLITTKRGVWSPELGVMPIPLHHLARLESIRLLQKLVAGLDGPTADEMAAESGDLPLALYLAGGFLRRYQQITPAQYLQQLREKGLLQHPSLQGRGVTHSPTGHELNVARTFALNFEQLDAADEVDRMAIRLLANAIAFAHGEAIPKQLLLACVQDGADDLMQELLAIDGLTRLLMLGIVREVASENVQLHRLVATYAEAELSETEVVAGRTVVERQVINVLAAQFSKTRFLGNLPVNPAHLQWLVQKGVARGDDLGTQLPLWWGRHQRDIGAREVAIAILETAVSARQALQLNDDLVLADLLALLGTLMWETSRRDEAWPMYEAVLAIRKEILGETHTLTAQALHNLAILHRQAGSLATAKTYYEQALAVYEQLSPPDEQQIALTLFNMALLLKTMNLFPESEAANRRSLTIRESLFPATNPSIAMSLNNLGVLAMQRGEYATALAYHERGLQIRRESLGEQHHITALSWLNLGHTKSKIGLTGEAEQDMQRSLAIHQEQLPADSYLIGQSLNFLGQHFYLIGNIEDAQHYLERALAILVIKQPTHYETADAYICLANCHLANGALDDARDCLEKACHIQEQALVTDHFFSSYRLLASGDLANAEGNVDLARQYYCKAIKIFGETAVPEHADWQLFKDKVTAVAS
ncbi:MAG: tetratricopeptide repeat protein [Ardenticatenaceae bacterium]|nr:tetratricopeptide repeat protein [Ardenticatenaceae bacterium]